MRRAPLLALAAALALLLCAPRAVDGVPIPAWRALTHRLSPRASPRTPAPPGPELCARGNLMFWKARACVTAHALSLAFACQGYRFCFRCTER
jgi:hypothetical protein